jgi:hypothetical protein
MEVCALSPTQIATRVTIRSPTPTETDEITEIMKVSLRKDRWQPLDLASGNYSARTVKNKWQFQS